MKKYFVLLIFFIVFSCKNNNSGITPTNDNLYVVDLDHAEQIDTFKLSFFFKNAKCIRLDDEKEALVGGISKFVAYNNYLYIADSRYSKSLIMFDMEGEFVRKIGSMGRGPGEYFSINDFTIDTEKNLIYLLDGGRIHIYDLDGKYLKTGDMPQDGVATTIQYYDGLIYSDIHAFKKTKDDYLLQAVDIENGQLVNRFLKTDDHNKGLNELIVNGMNYFIHKLEPPYLFRQTFMDTIFSITSEGIFPYLALRSKDLVTKKNLKCPPFTELSVFLSNHLIEKNKIYIVCDYFESSEYILFRYMKGFDSMYALFNKKNKTTQISSLFFNDLIFKENEKMTPQIFFFDQKGAYEYIHTIRLENYLLPLIGDNKLKEPFNDQLKNLNEESNPVIFYYEFK